MVPIVTGRSGFEAKVLAARLGCDGIVWQFRGGNPDSVYPVGGVDVLVREDDLVLARELLLADEVEEALSPDTEAAPAPEVWSSRWLAGAVLMAVGAFLALRLVVAL
jgi:hypothetical protein